LSHLLPNAAELRLLIELWLVAINQHLPWSPVQPTTNP
jgi:hypothetical protein